MKLDIHNINLSKINSLTKYPSIETYHKLDPKNGMLIEEALIFEDSLIATEKVDGTNARIICFPDGSYILGSREELLYAKGDLIGNPVLGIVDALKTKAEEIDGTDDNKILVFYCEVYGGKVTQASKQYTGERRVGYRLFDVVEIQDYSSLLEKTKAEISKWREQGGQNFLDEKNLEQIAKKYQFNLTPRIQKFRAEDFPIEIEDTYILLKNTLPESLCLLDDTGGGKPEGLVVRTSDRSQIAKLRFKDYERTLRKRGQIQANKKPKK